MIGTPYDHIADEFAAARTRLAPKEVEYLALVLDHVKAGSSILDLGCGTGHPIATHAASLGHRVVGVDGSETMLRIARRRLPDHRWIHAFMEDVSLDETFDAVVCWDSLFHLPRRSFAPVIDRVHRWLRPGGRLMVSSGGNVSDEGDGSLPPVSMVALVESTGFDIVVAEMCDQPDGGRNRGKWATVATRRGSP